MLAERIDIGGVPIDRLTTDEAVDRLVLAARERKFFQVSTVNLDFLVSASRDPEVRTILTTNGLNVADGAPVAWAGRMLGAGPMSRVSGADLVPLLIDAAAREGLRVFLLGGADGVALEAAQKLVDVNPGLQVWTCEPPCQPLDRFDNSEILRLLDEAQPHILLVAFGHPKQEKWIRRMQAHLPMVAIGVGCTFDLIVGRYRRAPQWVQRAGLEWFYRLSQEPQRLLRRYTGDAWWLLTTLVPTTLSQRLGKMFSRSGAAEPQGRVIDLQDSTLAKPPAEGDQAAETPRSA